MTATVSSHAEELVSRLGYVPEPMLTIRIPAFYSKIPHARWWWLRPRDSSLGRLDQFPPEVMLMIIKQLDLRSITNLQSVSFQGDAYVRSCAEYRDLLTHVPRALEALCALGLNRSHRVMDIHHVLQTDACATCGDRGPFLFLPTCKACLAYNPSLRFIRPADAKQYFGLSKAQCQELPTIHLPSHESLHLWGINMPYYCSWDDKAVSAKAAKDLALTVYGSEEAMVEAVERLSRTRYQLGSKMEYWLDAHCVPPRHRWLSPHKDGNIPWPPMDPDSLQLEKVSSMPFPTLTKRPTEKLELGLWCRGCVLAKDMLLFRADELFRN
ncbi:hypothetical protein PG996_008808 [Apiospora saccharicola]|uniref:F-box domain-containing protein n=1 Tax=Apiospora saccharicola TaxID=335842 RepID=A0ABR1UYZ5_9PEZI